MFSRPVALSTGKSHEVYIKQTADGYITTMPVQAAEWEGVLRSLELLGPDEEFPGLAETRQRIPEITAAYRGFTTAVLEERLLVRPHSTHGIFASALPATVLPWLSG